MTQEERKALIRAVYEHPSGFDIDKFYANATEDFVFIRSPLPPVAGIEANRKSDEETMAAFSDWEIIIHDLVAEGDVVVMPYTWKAVNTGDIVHLGIPATGKAVESNACGMFYFQGDKIAKMVDYFDTLGFLQQLGLFPAMA